MVMKKVNAKICIGCKRSKQPEAFYSTSSKMYPDGKLSLCKTCIKNMIDPTDQESVKGVLRQIDKPFIASLWTACFDATDNPVGQYLRQINSLPQYKGLTWDNSQFGEGEAPAPNVAPPSPVAPVVEVRPAPTQQVPLELFEKWGLEFTPQEVTAFEVLFNNLKNNYKLTTASHVEFLKLACISRVKAVNAMSRGDTKDARDYMAIFKDMTSAGKLQPSQFSKSDLSDGLDGFGQLVRQVEKMVDVIPTLPRFKERPQDKVDVVLWAYVNYVRSLKGLDEASYEDIWGFYDVRKKDYESAMLKSMSEGDQGDE